MSSGRTPLPQALVMPEHCAHAPSFQGTGHCIWEVRHASWELHLPGTVHHSDQQDAGRGADSQATGSFMKWAGCSLFFCQ